MTNGVSWLLIASQAVISGSGILLIRFAGQRFTGWSTTAIQVMGAGALGLVAYAASFALWVYILSKTQASYAFPVTIGISLFVTTVGAVVLFQEKITGIQAVGIFLLIIAVALISIFGAPK